IIINEIIPILKDSEISTSKNDLLGVSSLDLPHVNLYFNGVKLDNSLKNCYQIIYNLFKYHQLTSTQKRWTIEHKLDFSETWKRIKNFKTRPSIKSFLIKLFNNALFLPDTCPCGQIYSFRQMLQHTLIDCNFHNNLFHSANFSN